MANSTWYPMEIARLLIGLSCFPRQAHGSSRKGMENRHQTALESPWEQRVAKEIHGDSWPPTATRSNPWGWLWLHMVTNGSSHGDHGHPCQPMIPHGYSWQPMATHGNPWQLMVAITAIHGSAGQHKAMPKTTHRNLQGIPCQYPTQPMVTHSNSWQPTAIHGNRSSRMSSFLILLQVSDEAIPVDCTTTSSRSPWGPTGYPKESFRGTPGTGKLCWEFHRVFR